MTTKRMKAEKLRLAKKFFKSLNYRVKRCSFPYEGFIATAGEEAWVVGVDEDNTLVYEADGLSMQRRLSLMYHLEATENDFSQHD